MCVVCVALELGSYVVQYVLDDIESHGKEVLETCNHGRFRQSIASLNCLELTDLGYYINDLSIVTWHDSSLQFSGNILLMPAN